MDPIFQIDIKKTNLEISLIKHPLTFLFMLISYNNEISDYHLSITLKIFLKYHSNIAINYNLKKIFIKELLNYPLSWNVLCSFYKFINKKINLIFILKKWYSCYSNPIFWKLQITEQIDYLQQIKENFMGIYDCSKGGVSYYIRLGNILQNTDTDRSYILDDAKERLTTILNIFGQKLFQALDIPLILVSDFYDLSNENLIKYFIVIFEKFLELLNHTIALFDSYNLICIQLNNLLNPIIININSKLIDSETENEDIKLFCSHTL
jgi:hypothetical protein